MKRAPLVGVLAVAAICVAGSSAAVHTKVTRAQAATRLGGMLGARPQRVHLVWISDIRTVDLEWTAYSPHARIRVLGGPVGTTVPQYVRGPARAWLGADGAPPEGVGTVRPLRGHHVLPMRSTTIPVSLVQALGRDGARIRLTPLRVHPTISRVHAIAKLRQWGDAKKRLEGIWLVWFRRGGGGRKQLAWMAVTLHARVPIYGCTQGKRCKHTYTSPLASFLSARTSKGIEALTINGWKRPQLPPG